MSWSPEDSLDEHGRSPREVRRAYACRCAGANDWPGHCPGPTNCPCVSGSVCDECGREMTGDECASCATDRKAGEAFVAKYGMPSWT